MGTKTEIARKLLQINAIKLSPQKPFTWASGLRSPIYCDNRTILSFPEVRKFIIDAFASAAASFQPFDGVAGVATAGIPHGILLAERLDLPFIYVRAEPKSHGRQNQIEGIMPSGSKMLVIEDLISTGGSSIKAVEAIRQAGGIVSGVIAIFSYGFQQAEMAFKTAECPFYALSDYDHLIQMAEETGYMNGQELELLKNWKINPQEWGEQVPN